MDLSNELPVELLEMIFSHLEKKDHVTLSRVCQLFRLILNPWIYRRISCYWDQATSAKFPIHLLLRTCVEQPNLGSFVKEIEFHGIKPSSIWPDRRMTRSMVKQRQLMLKPILDFAHTADDGTGQRWGKSVQMGDPDVYMALLLWTLPQLRILRFGITFQQRSRYVGLLLKRILFGPAPDEPRSSFEHLQHVECCTNFPSSKIPLPAPWLQRNKRPVPVDFDEMLAFFHLPSIQHLTLLMPHSPLLDWPTDLPCTSTLSTLVLHHSEMREETLEQLLSVTPVLQELRYTAWRNPELPHQQSGYVHADLIRNALEHVRPTLQRLKIEVVFHNTDRVIVQSGDAWGIKKNLGSLQGFEQLQSLEVSIALLLGWDLESAPQLTDVLPSSIRRVCLRDDLGDFLEYGWNEQAILDQIGKLVVNRRQRTPDLELIKLHQAALHGVWGQEGWEELKSICERAGIDGEIWSWDNTQYH